LDHQSTHLAPFHRVALQHLPYPSGDRLLLPSPCSTTFFCTLGEK
jgi:hypothetical protein